MDDRRRFKDFEKLILDTSEKRKMAPRFSLDLLHLQMNNNNFIHYILQQTYFIECNLFNLKFVLRKLLKITAISTIY